MKFTFQRPILCLLMASFLFLTAVACGGEAAAPENVFIAIQTDSGRTVTIGVGDVLQVMLPENQSTGYQWAVVTNDESVLPMSDAPAYEVDSDAAGDAQTFLFAAAAPGTSVLRLVNARAQETAVEPAATFELTVQVVESP
jgi:predicted secreted protein